MAEPLLVGRGLVKRYGGVVAVSNVDISVAPGEVLGLVGPNGAGKTTLVDLITGAQSADEGELTLEGRKLSGPASKRARAGLARTFQYPQLAPELSVYQNILVGRTARQTTSLAKMILGALRGVVRLHDPADEAALVEIIADVRIEGLERLAGDLSLGEQRLTEVARALAQDPLVMLLDEPFAGSDARGVAGVSEAIRTVKARGHAVVLVDHNVDLVASLVDRIVLLEQGAVAFDGEPAACLASEEMQRVYFGTGVIDVG